MGLAPAAPEAGLSVGLILLAVACVFLLALNKVYRYSVGALLSAMSSMVSSLPHVTILGKQVPPWDALASGITELDNYVLEAIGTGIQQTEKGLHALVGAMTWLLQETADQVAGLAEDTARAFDYTKRILIPALLGAALAPIVAQLSHLAARTKTIILHPTTIVHATTRVIAPGLKALEGKVSQLEGKVAALATAGTAAVLAPPISVTLPGVTQIPGDLTHGIDAIRKRLGQIGKVLTPAGVAGLVAGAVLSSLRLPWLKCRNVDKVGRKLCGMNSNLLDDLLGGLLVIFGTFSLVEFARYMEPVAGELAGEITHFWRADVAHAQADREIGSPGLTNA